MEKTVSSPERELARRIITRTGQHLFLTGKAGTGKTTFLRELVAEAPKRMVVLAPTGIAAINAGGMTIHSFFQLPFAPFVPGSAYGEQEARYRYRFGKEKTDLIRSLDLVVIDEISMVRADLLDAVDDVLQRIRRCTDPFGGVQMLLIGDIRQLPPVARNEDWELLSAYYDTPYFFSSRALRRSGYLTVELRHVFRQQDPDFLEILENLRTGTDIPRTLERLNRRCLPGFDPDDAAGYIRLTTHNSQARSINERKMEELPDEVHRFTAEIEGEFPPSSYPTDEVLELKAGAQVMFIKNDISGRRRFVNGSIGRVVRITDSRITVRLQDDGSEVDVEPMEWSNARYRLDPDTREIVEEILGVFRQQPLKPAWAITIHKSQGLTFDRAVIDTASAFSHGQTYVALSRCRTLEGIVLQAPVPASALIRDEAVSRFSEDILRHPPQAEAVEALEEAYRLSLLDDLFDFRPLLDTLRRFGQILEKDLDRLYPNLCDACDAGCTRLSVHCVEVSRKFRPQYARLLRQENGGNGTEADHSPLTLRLRQAIGYFLPLLREIEAQCCPADRVSTDNRILQRRVDSVQQELRIRFRDRFALLEDTAENGFDAARYLQTRTRLALSDPPAAQPGRKTAGKGASGNRPGKPAQDNQAAAADIRNPRLYEALTAWRRAEAVRLQIPAYTILAQKALLSVTNREPRTERELLALPYIGPVTVRKYGGRLLELVAEYGSARSAAPGEPEVIPGL